MAKFAERLKGAFEGARDKIQDVRTLSKVKGAELCGLEQAEAIIHTQLSKLFGREDFFVAGSNQSEAEYKEQIQQILSRLWPDDYDPDISIGSISSYFNFLLMRLACGLDARVPEEKFFATLKCAVEESTFRDLWLWFGEDSEKVWFGSLRTRLPEYLARHYPNSGNSIVNEITQRLQRRKRFDSSENSEGLIYNVFSSIILEDANEYKVPIATYIEYFYPELVEHEYVAILYNLHPSLKPNTNQRYAHWIFTDAGIVIIPDRNRGDRPYWIPRENVESITFGVAYDALSENGVYKYQNWKILMYGKFGSGNPTVLYQYKSSSKQDAFMKIHDFRNEIIPHIADYYDVYWTDEVMDDSSHYTRTTTYTYWTWG